MDIVVLFIGLMLHIGPDIDKDGFVKTHIAIVDEPGQHTATVSVLNAAGGVVDSEPIAKGDKISFKHGIGIARTNQMFRDTVPHLQKNTRKPPSAQGELDPEPAGAGTHPHVLAYFFYPPSSNLRVKEHSSCRAEFVLDDPNPPLEQVSTTNQLSAPAPTGGAATIEISNNQTIRKTLPVPSGHVVVISNRPRNQGQHFAHYKDLTDATRIAFVKRSGQLCSPVPTGDALMKETSGPVRILLDPFPECSNSQWP